MKYVFRVDDVMRACGSKELDDAGDYIIDCFREALGEKHFGDISIEHDTGNDNPWFHSFIIYLDKNIASDHNSKIVLNLDQAKLRYTFE